VEVSLIETLFEKVSPFETLSEKVSLIETPFEEVSQFETLVLNSCLLMVGKSCRLGRGQLLDNEDNDDQLLTALRYHLGIFTAQPSF